MPIGLAVAVVIAVVALLGVFAAIDSGRLNAPIARFASERLNRPVKFASMQAHLLSARPSVTFQALVIGSPPWAGGVHLLEADRLSLTFRWPDFAVTDVDVDRPRLNLLRTAPDQANWTSAKSGGGGGSNGGIPSSLSTLHVADGRFAFEDRVGDLHMTGTGTYDPGRSAALPLVLTARGLLKGGDVLLSAQGGPLVQRALNAPYPFSAKIQDGATFLEAQGVSEKPAQLSGFDLIVAARGPNLGDMKYLIDLGLPNSAPYRLTAKLSRKGQTTRATDLKAVIGQSDFSGSVVSDGSKTRRLITIKLASQTLYAADIGTLLGHIPGHATTRSVSGAAKSGGAPGPMLSTTPIDLKRFRLKDAQLDITAQRFVIGGISPGRLSAVGTLDHGKFTLKPFRIDFPSGRADAVLDMDLNGPNPAFRVAGTVQNADLATLVPVLAKTVGGAADLGVDVRGAGSSWKAIGLNAQGRIGLTLRNGDIQISKADVISGAVVQGAFAALANKNARTALSCAAAQFSLGRGQILGQKILLVTDAGTAVAEGGVNLAKETLDLTIHGRPSGFRLFAENAPVSLSGPMLHPKAQVRLPGIGGGGRPSSQEAPKVEGDRTAYCNEQLAGGPIQAWSR